MSDDNTDKDWNDLSHPDNRIALGVALGTPLGVVISLLLDNWAFIGVGLVLGVAIGAIPARGSSARDDDDAEPDR